LAVQDLLESAPNFLEPSPQCFVDRVAYVYLCQDLRKRRLSLTEALPDQPAERPAQDPQDFRCSAMVSRACSRMARTCFSRTLRRTFASTSSISSLTRSSAHGLRGPHGPDRLRGSRVVLTGARCAISHCAAKPHATGRGVTKSGSRGKAEGTVDKIAGSVMEAVSKLTGNRSAGAKSKAARGRRAMRKTKGRAKQAK
jgi:uncharacterized protein YjbJ (UPF0337 family)